MKGITPTLPKQYLKVFEKLDWQVREYGDGTVVLENWSPEGEDLVLETTRINFLKDIREWYENFDPDEHAAELIPHRGKYGIPHSVWRLADDARKIDEMLEDLTIALISAPDETQEESEEEDDE